MSESTLPSDLRDWPDDPYELLDVRHDVTARDLKRAYTRLIRVYKPEHHPDQFRKIREAYEQVLKNVEANQARSSESSPWGTPEAQRNVFDLSQFQTDFPKAESPKPLPPKPAPPPPPSEPPSAWDDVIRIPDEDVIQIPNEDRLEGDLNLEMRAEVPPAEIPLELVSPAQPTFPEPLAAPQSTLPEPPVALPPRSTGDPADDAWRKAENGNEDGAYRDFQELLLRYRERADLYARLYWLRLLWPKLDVRKQPCDWLTDGLARTSLALPLTELYAPEIMARPEEAASERCNRLVRVEASVGALEALLHARWAGLVRLARWDLLVEDLKVGRDRVRNRDERAWLRLLNHVINWAAWDRDDPDANNIRVFVRDELRNLEHLAVSEGMIFDRLDVLRTTVASWRHLRETSRETLPLAFLEVLRDGWMKPMLEVRRDFEAILSRISNDPESWLKRFDSVDEEGLNCIHHFAFLLDRYREHIEHFEEVLPVSRSSIRRILKQIGPDGMDYGRLRPLLLEECLDGGIELDQLADALKNYDRDTDLEKLGEIVRGDGPMRLVCWACRLFRA